MQTLETKTENPDTATSHQTKSTQHVHTKIQLYDSLYDYEAEASSEWKSV